MLCNILLWILLIKSANSSNHAHFHVVSNKTLSGTTIGCRHTTPYTTTSNVQFNMCTGQTDVDLKNGMSIINLIGSRGYLPTCRILHLMLWMASEVGEKQSIVKDAFVDIGSNIGSCTVHMASLGFPVIAAEPVQQHYDTIRGSADINPSFNIEVHHIGISGIDRSIKANFGHGSRNWGASEFHEVGQNESFELELVLKTLDQVVGHRRVSLLKIDCEGCEWETLLGGKRTLRRVPMMKIELVQPEYSSGNATVSAADIVQFLHENNFDLYADLWNEQNLYFGKRGNEILDIDRMFGSHKFKLKSDESLLHLSARQLLLHPIEAKTFSHKQFLRSYTDIIAIERTLSALMLKKWII